MIVSTNTILLLFSVTLSLRTLFVELVDCNLDNLGGCTILLSFRNVCTPHNDIIYTHPRYLIKSDLS